MGHSVTSKNKPSLWASGYLKATPINFRESATDLYGWNIINPNAVPVYVKMYDATAGAVGASTPWQVVGIPAESSKSFIANFSIKRFTTGLRVAVVTGLDIPNTTAPASDVHVDIYFK